MLCDECKEREAKIFYTNVVGEKFVQKNLCEECAKRSGVDDPNFAFADMLLGIGAAQAFEQAAGGSQVRCPRCGFSQADFKKAGRLGCPDCYTTFAEGLEGFLKSMHKGTRHVGKAPQAMQQTRDLSDHLKALQKKLAQAVAAEKFEQAALLRDEIKQTSARLSQVTPVASSQHETR
jgi:protein arginine kinase activator